MRLGEVKLVKVTTTVWVHTTKIKDYQEIN